MVVALLFWAALAGALERFPRPDLSNTYRTPEAIYPGLTPAWVEWLDMGLLAGALLAAAWLALRRRSRRGLFVLSLLCLAYFGFWREGCLCPVGSPQLIAEGLATGLALPLTAVAFFVLPLLAALLFGRVFCAAVCPLGALQDLVAVRPHRLSRGLDAGLQLLPVIMLALSVLLAVTQTAYLTCRFDPLVPLLRRTGSTHGVLMGAAILLLGIVVARPLCRFLCPYGVLLRGLSRLSWRHVTITPDTCVSCRLCADSCPFDAIEGPSPESPAEPVRAGTRRLAWLCVLAPVLVAGFALLFARLGPHLARLHADVCLSDHFLLEEAGAAAPTVESTAFRSSLRRVEELHDAARQKREALRRGGAWAGAYVGLVLAIRLIGASVRPRRSGYEPDRGRCLSCGRCFLYCPVEQVRLHPLPEA
jgi:NosR/NirI family transcriptional regulator, nitrous oxide reductase regulator